MNALQSLNAKSCPSTGFAISPPLSLITKVKTAE